MTDSLLPALLTLAFAAVVAASMMLLSWWLGPRRMPYDGTPYECGIVPLDAVEQHRFSVRFYLVAMIFILFDVEAAFLYPWAVTFRDFAEARLFVLLEMMVFLGILVVGFLYLWWRGALEWE